MLGLQIPVVSFPPLHRLLLSLGGFVCPLLFPQFVKSGLASSLPRLGALLIKKRQRINIETVFGYIAQAFATARTLLADNDHVVDLNVFYELRFDMFARKFTVDNLPGLFRRIDFRD